MCKIWQCIEALDGNDTPKWRWEKALGDDFPLLLPFLHEVAFRENISLLRGGETEEITISDDETVTRRRIFLPEGNVEFSDCFWQELDMNVFCRELGKTLGIESKGTPELVLSRTWNIGSYGSKKTPVFLTVQSKKQEFYRVIAELLGRHAEPFAILSPTLRFLDSKEGELLERHSISFLSLQSAIAIVPEGLMKPIISPSAISNALSAKKTETLEDRASILAMLATLREEVRGITGDVAKLRSANEELAKATADGLLAFAKKVPPKDFGILCRILAEGDVAKASVALKMADSTLREVLHKWKAAGGVYESMLELVKWRKRAGRGKTISLNDNVVLDMIHQNNAPDELTTVLREVLKGLEEMNSQSWPGICKDLQDTLRDHVN